MNKELIKEVVKEMIRDGEIEVVWDRPINKCASVEDRADVEDVLEYAEYRLEVSDD